MAVETNSVTFMPRGNGSTQKLFFSSASLFTPRMRSDEKQEKMIITVCSCVRLQDWEMIYSVNTSKRLDQEVIYSLIYPIWFEEGMGTVCSTQNMPESYRLEARGALPLLCVWMWRYSGSLVWTENQVTFPLSAKGRTAFSAWHCTLLCIPLYVSIVYTDRKLKWLLVIVVFILTAFPRPFAKLIWLQVDHFPDGFNDCVINP